MTRPVLIPALLCLGLTTGCTAVEIQNISRLPEAEVLPRHTEGTYLNMGRSLLASNQPHLAYDAFIRSMRVEGLSAQALSGAGLALERQGLLKDALRYFRKAARIEPNSVLVQNNLGAVLYRLGEYGEARQAFQAAFALSSGKNRMAQHNLGLSEMALERQRREELALAPNPLPIQRGGSMEYLLPGPTTEEQEG